MQLQTSSLFQSFNRIHYININSLGDIVHYARYISRFHLSLLCPLPEEIGLRDAERSAVTSPVSEMAAKVWIRSRNLWIVGLYTENWIDMVVSTVADSKSSV
jgi:hypothetical protein